LTCGGDPPPTVKRSYNNTPNEKGGKIAKLTKHRKNLVNPTRENPLQNQQVTDPLKTTPSAQLFIPLGTGSIQILAGIGKHAKLSCTLHADRKAW
jgi:hypothetical protein